MASKKELDQMMTWLKSIAADKDSFDGINAQRCLNYITALRGASDLKGIIIANQKKALRNAVIFKGTTVQCGKHVHGYEYNGYNIDILYSDEDKEYYGKIVGISDLVIFFLPSNKKKVVEKTIKQVVDDYTKLKNSLVGTTFKQITIDEL